MDHSAVMKWLGSAERNQTLESSEDDEIPVAKSLKIPPPPPPTQKIQPSESKVHGRSAATKPSVQLDKDGECAKENTYMKLKLDPNFCLKVIPSKIAFIKQVTKRQPWMMLEMKMPLVESLSKKSLQTQTWLHFSVSITKTY